MTVAETKATASRNRRPWVPISLVLVALAVVAGVALWWESMRSLSDGERALVGTWRYRWAGQENDLPLEYEFRPNRTCVIRYFDQKAPGSSTGLTWRLAGDKLVVRHPDMVVGPAWDILGLRRHADETSVLTPDGPDRFRYTGTIESGGTPGSSVEGTMTRIAPVR